MLALPPLLSLFWPAALWAWLALLGSYITAIISLSALTAPCEGGTCFRASRYFRGVPPCLRMGLSQGFTRFYHFSAKADPILHSSDASVARGSRSLISKGAFFSY